MRYPWAAAIGLALASCTPGAPPAGGDGLRAATIVDVSLTSSVPASTPYGSSAGYAPAVTVVATGSTVQFVNRDSFAHTASSLAAAAFPAASPLGAAALAAAGGRLSSGWSSGTLAAGAASQVLLADLPGTYLYGCFYHYGAPMRAAIVVR